MLYNFRHWSFFRWFLPAFSLLVGGPLQAVPPVGSGILTPQDLNPVIKRGEGPLCWRPHLMSLAPARWIWLPSQRTLPNTFVLFRREVTLEAAPQDAPAWITADSRYRLTVNGRRVLWGPAPCDPRQMDVDPVNLAPYLRQGRNVIGVEVLHYGIGEGTWPAGKPGLLFQAQVAMDGGRQVSIVSDASWKCLLDRAHPPGQFKRWFLRTLQEEFDARLHPLGWDTVEFQPDSGWLPAMVLDCPADKPSSCSNYPGNDGVDRTDPTHAALRHRQIPALHSRTCRLCAWPPPAGWNGCATRETGLSAASPGRSASGRTRSPGTCPRPAGNCRLWRRSRESTPPSSFRSRSSAGPT